MIKRVVLYMLLAAVLVPTAAHAAGEEQKIDPEYARMAFEFILGMGDDALSTKDPKEALIYFEYVLTMHSEYATQDDILAQAHRGIGAARMALKNYPAAMRALKRSNKIKSDSETLQLMSECAGKRGMTGDQKRYKEMSDALR